MTEPTDAELLDFDGSRLEDWSEDTARRLLEEQPVIYRNHLEIAKWIDGWVERMHRDARDEFQAGYEKGVREIAAHLRQGDLVPQGALLNDS
jgi:hypothetical protein